MSRGQAHERTFNGSRKDRSLAAERTCLWRAEALEAARAAGDVALGAFGFRPDHVHLLLGPHRPVSKVAPIRRTLKGPVGHRAPWSIAHPAPEWLPRITQRRGPRVERPSEQPGGGWDRNLVEPRTLRALIESMHLNPMRRGWVARARDGRWSSAAWFEGWEGNVLGPDLIPPEWTVEGSSVTSAAFGGPGHKDFAPATRSHQPGRGLILRLTPTWPGSGPPSAAGSLASSAPGPW
jgi:putative transposase